MAESLDHGPSEDGKRFLQDELEALRSIYTNDINISEHNGTTVVSIDLHPSTADNLEEQYVKLTLKLTIRDDYPDVIPHIEIRNPRGLSEDKLSSITNDLLKITEDKRGSSMLFEIIEAAKDFLTADNRPCEVCAICLYGFHDDDIFTKTECYHYFHSHCLARYAKRRKVFSDDDSDSDDSSQNELHCPVCRLPIHFEGVDDSYPSPVNAEDKFSVSETLLQTQKKLQDLYIKQVEKGGIIDLEAEKNKYLIEISHVPSVLDAASEVKSEDEESLKVSEETVKSQKNSPPEKAKDNNLASQNYSSNRSQRYDHRFTKNNEERNNEERFTKNNEERFTENNEERFTKNTEERFTKNNEERGNGGSRPYYGNGYRNGRYNGNRGGGYRRNQRDGRNNYDRRFESYNNGRGDMYGRGRYNNPRRNNFHDNQQRGGRFERRGKYDDENSQRYERHEKYDDENSHRYERRNKYDDENSRRYDRNDDENSRRYDRNYDENSRRYERLDKYGDKDRNCKTYDDTRGGTRKKEHEDKDVAAVRDDVEVDKSEDNNQINEADGVQDKNTGEVVQEKRNERYTDDRRNVRYSGGYKNNQYDNRRENRYDKHNVRYDNNRRYDRSDGNGALRYVKKNGRFDNPRYNNYNGTRKNEHFGSSRSRQVNQDQENEDNEISQENEADTENMSRIERENLSVQPELANEECVDEREHNEENTASRKHSSKEVSENVLEGAHETKLSDNLSNRNSSARNQTDNRTYNQRYQRSNSNRDRYNDSGRYSKQSDSNRDRYNGPGRSNYNSERKQTRSQNYRRNSNNLDEVENVNTSESNEAVAAGDEKPPENNLEEDQKYNNEESRDVNDDQHSKQASTRNDSGNMNHNRNYRDGRQGYNNRYQNDRNYNDTRPYRNNPRFRSNQGDFSDRTSKRYIPQKYAPDSSCTSPQTENGSDVKSPTVQKEIVDSVIDETSSKKPTSVPPKDPKQEKLVPTSNFLPPMSSIAPPPGFINSGKKVVYGLAAANPPPGFNRS